MDLLTTPKITHHVRRISPDQIYHVMSKTWGGLYLMAPKDGVTEKIIGILAKAKGKYPMIKLYYAVFLSNHFHMMVQGANPDFSKFVGFIKQQISTRLGIHHDLSGTLWGGRYGDTALTTENSTVDCLIYLLSQGPKEDLVERPQDWPGMQGVNHLMFGQKLKGVWFDGTGYAIAKNKASKLKNPPPVKRKDFYQELELEFDTLPVWEDKSEEERQVIIREKVEEIIEKEKTRRQEKGKRVLGVKRAKAMNVFLGSPPPRPPFWKYRKRVITAWASLRDVATIKYIEAYWEFQRLYRIAAEALKQGLEEPEFPPGAWLPSIYR